MILTINYLNGEKRVINVTNDFREQQVNFKTISMEEKVESIAKSFGKNPLVAILSNNGKKLVTKLFSYQVNKTEEIKFIPFENKRKKEYKQQYKKNPFVIKTNNIRNIQSLFPNL